MLRLRRNLPDTISLSLLNKMIMRRASLSAEVDTQETSPDRLLLRLVPSFSELTSREVMITLR